MMNLSDPNYLLIEEAIPEGYLDPELREVSNVIMREVDELRGTDMYGKWIKEQGYKMNQENKIIVLVDILQLYKTDKELAEQTLRDCGLKYKTEKEVEKAYNNRMFDLKVEKRQEEAQLQRDELTKKIMTFEEMCIPIEEVLKITIDYEITATKFIAWENRYKERLRQKSA